MSMVAFPSSGVAKVTVGKNKKKSKKDGPLENVCTFYQNQLPPPETTMTNKHQSQTVVISQIPLGDADNDDADADDHDLLYLFYLLFPYLSNTFLALHTNLFGL